MVLSPWLVLLAIFALIKDFKGNLICFVWFAVFFIGYLFWAGRGDDWEFIRFLLPAYPAVFLMAANGVKTIWSKNKEVAKAIVLGLMLFILPCYIYFGLMNGIYSFKRGKVWYEVAKKVDELTPRNSVIMTVEFSGAIRLYANRETYMWWHTESARKLTSELIKNCVPVYCITNSTKILKEIIRPYKFKLITYLPEPNGSCLYKIEGY